MGRRKFKKGSIYGVFVHDASTILLLAINKFYYDNGVIRKGIRKKLYGMGLVALAGLTQSHISKLLNIFEENGLVVKTLGKDNRKKEVTLTEKGKEVAEELQQMKDRLET